MKLRRSSCIAALLVFAIFNDRTAVNLALATDQSHTSAKDSTMSKSALGTASDSPSETSPNADKPKVSAPLQGYAKRDTRGTPVVPEWKMQAGYDALLGKFYVGIVGLKVLAINGPPPAAVLGTSQLKHWKGHKPHPCVLKFTKLQDTSGGYYFQSIGSVDGPRGWIIPQPAEPHKAKEWAIYFMQAQDTNDQPDQGTELPAK
jgi:hypothetical protein